jgi:predicted enzyme related to lactoylglutathione lyase
MARITGIGGIFIKSRDPKALSAWYRDKLGLNIEDWGGALLPANSDGPPRSVWNPFEQSTKYFEPSSREMMINFAVDDLNTYIAQIEAKGVKVLGREDHGPVGQFAWVMDPDGTKIEFWQPHSPA